MRKPKISLEPQQISKTAWYYENPRSIDVVVECREGREGAEGKLHSTLTVRIPARKLRKSLERMGGK